MITGKKIGPVCVVVTLLALVFTILFMNGAKFGITAVIDDDTEGASYFSSNDLNGSWEASAYTHITLNGDSADVSGNGAYYYDGDVLITSAGYYLISGKLDNGSVIVDSNGSSKVWIKLDGVDIYADDDAAIRVDQAKKVFLTLADSSSNYLSSGSSLSDAAVADGTDGVIFAHDNLCINGNGTLQVNAGYMHGIVAKDNLILAGGNILINASKDGIRANESLRIANASVSVTSGDDALTINHDDGYLYVASGEVKLKAEDDGVNSLGNVTVDGGTVTVSAGDDGIHSDKAVVINNGTVLMEKCYEGIEAVTVTMNDGDVTIYPSDDGINANGGTGDSFGGFGGRPGENAGFSERADGESGFPGRPDSEDGFPERPDGENVFPQRPDDSGNNGVLDTETANSDLSAEETYVRINGGRLNIINTTAQDADGIDSNGSIYISGGDVRISLPGNGTNSAVDYASESGGVCEISGGTVIACGSYMMAEGFDSSSPQCSILYNYSQGVDAGSVVSLEDASGSILLEYEAPVGFSSVGISCPGLQTGNTYRIRIGDISEEFTLNETAQTIGDVSGGFAPGFRP
ncbi:MAG: carbohydrate-binding domain-containing protein [Lachnospiraceae bacterium]|nr:carbohydrate-binding domain-containing protein [Lachnospiraceae bacterium]